MTINKKINSSFEIKKYGFTQFSEKLNGRISMIAFVFLYFIEFTTKKTLFDLLTSLLIHWTHR
jgi:hypothetical protein